MFQYRKKNYHPALFPSSLPSALYCDHHSVGRPVDYTSTAHTISKASCEKEIDTRVAPSPPTALCAALSLLRQPSLYRCSHALQLSRSHSYQFFVFLFDFQFTFSPLASILPLKLLPCTAQSSSNPTES